MSDLRLCKDRTCGADKTSGIGDAWQGGTALARGCCMNTASKRISQCDKSKAYIKVPLDTFACSVFNSNSTNSTATSFLMTATVEYIPPITTDIQNGGKTEVCFCFGASCPTVVSPICIQFQARPPPPLRKIHTPVCLLNGTRCERTHAPPRSERNPGRAYPRIHPLPN